MSTTTIGDAFIKIRPDTDGFSEETEAGTSGGLGKLAGMATVAAAGFAVLGVASVKAAQDDEAAQTRLSVAFKNTGQNMGSYQGQIKTTINTMASYGFTSSQTQDALAQLETATKNPTQAMSDLLIAADVAKAKNIDLASATTMVTKASQGNTAALTRAGIISKAQAKDITSGAQALGVLQSAYGGAAQAATGTFGGSLAALKAMLTNTLSGIGQTIIPALSKILPIIGPVLTSLGGGIAKIFTGIAPILTSIVPVIGQILQTLGSVIGSVLSGIAPIFTAIMKAITPLLPVIGKLAETFAGILGKALTALAPLLGELASTLSGVLGDALKTILPPVVALIQALIGPLMSVLQALLPPILSVVTAVAGALMPVIAALLPPITMVVGVVGKLVEGLAQALAPIIKAITPVITQLGGVLQMLAGFIGKLLEALLPILPPIAQLLQALLPLLPAILQIATALLSALMPILQALMPIITQVISWIAQLVAILVTYLAGAIKVIVTDILNLGDTFSTIWAGIQFVASAAWNWLNSNVFQPLISVIRDTLTTELNILQSTFNTVFNAIKSVVNTVWGIIKPIIDAMTSAIHDVTGAASAIAKGVGGAASALTGGFLAGGGPARSGVPYVIGEEGPEVFVPDGNGVVLPNSVFSAGASFRSSGLPDTPFAVGSVSGGGSSGPVIQTEVNLQIAGIDMSNLGAVQSLVDTSLEKHTDDVVDAINARTGP